MVTCTCYILGVIRGVNRALTENDELIHICRVRSTRSKYVIMKFIDISKFSKVQNKVSP